jgi:4a-hydroxytetrahydrobiopterin dehydratase
MSELAARDLVPSRGDDDPLKGNALDALAGELNEGWQVVDEHHLEKRFEFDDFAGALAFTNQVGEMADRVNHHPEICLSWGYAEITIWTHSIGGLHEADFVFAAKADALAEAV